MNIDRHILPKIAIAGMFLLLVLLQPVWATGQQIPMHQSQTQTLGQTQSAAGGAAGAGGSVSSDHWAVSMPNWGGSYGAELTVCNSGWGWGAWWGPDHQCIELVYRLRALQATPVPKPERYLSIDPPLGERRREPYPTLNADVRERVGDCPKPPPAKPRAPARAASSAGKGLDLCGRPR